MGKRNAQATRGGREPWPAWIWLLAGVLLGVGVSGVALWRDWLPALRGDGAPRPNPEAVAPSGGEIGVAETKPVESRPKYDFYSVLPEMEVVIPDAEVSAAATQPATPATAEGARLFLQTGSFRVAADAEQMKARLALLGLRAQVVAVTINGVAWHRVRVGPFGGARELDEARRTLAGNGIEAIALREATP